MRQSDWPVVCLLRRLMTTGMSEQPVLVMDFSAWASAAWKFSLSTRLASINNAGVPTRSAPPEYSIVPPPDNGARNEDKPVASLI